MSGTRSFVAIELSDEVRERLAAARRALIEVAPSWGHEKWVAENNLHVTLRFLGNLGDCQLDELRSDLAAVLADAPAFPLFLSGLRAVPKPARASMVWARFEDAEGECAALAGRVESASLALGLEPEERAFSPHVTLARARRPRRLDHEALTSANAVACAPPLTMSVPSVTLFASTLTPTGPVYEVVDSWTLREPE